MGREGTSRGTDRESVTWSGSEEDGSRRKRFAVISVAALALVIAALAGTTTAKAGNGNPGAVVPSSLIAAAQANPDQIFHVIVQGSKGNSSSTVAQDVTGNNGKVKRHKCGKRHLNAHKTGKRKRQLRGATVHDGRIAAKYILALGGQ